MCTNITSMHTLACTRRHVQRHRAPPSSGTGPAHTRQTLGHNHRAPPATRHGGHPGPSPEPRTHACPCTFGAETGLDPQGPRSRDRGHSPGGPPGPAGAATCEVLLHSPAPGHGVPVPHATRSHWQGRRVGIWADGVARGCREASITPPRGRAWAWGSRGLRRRALPPTPGLTGQSHWAGPRSPRPVLPPPRRSRWDRALGERVAHGTRCGGGHASLPAGWGPADPPAAPRGRACAPGCGGAGVRGCWAPPGTPR